VPPAAPEPAATEAEAARRQPTEPAAAPRQAADTPIAVGRVRQVNVSAGGVPKRPVASAHVGWLGLEGDGHHEATLHGGPHRAVCLFAIEAIRRVAAEGHPIEPGSVGENLTTEGIELSTLPVGTRLRIGRGLLLELSAPDDPCKTIAAAFSDGRFARISIVGHPTDSRMYARVLVEGVVRPTDPIEVLPPMADSRAAVERQLFRVDAAERSSAVAQWRAAAQAGYDVRIVVDGELAMVAAPELPGPYFNAAHGLRSLPHLLGRVQAHFRGNGTVGWLTSDRPPWPAAAPDRRLAILAAPVDAIGPAASVDGVRVRRLGREEAATWAEVLVAASALEAHVERAWRDLALPLAAGAHTSLFVAERPDGRAVGAASLHTHRRVGYLRATAVLPAERGRGIQRALIAARAATAAELGCELLAASALAGSSSEKNLLRSGLRRLTEYGQYRFDPAA
jgi:MOSC domain-containing protein YiiM/GNAT superfamily N-acetyltransferase